MTANSTMNMTQRMQQSHDFFRMHLEGFKPNSILNDVLAQRQREIKERSQELAKALAARQEAVEGSVAVLSNAISNEEALKASEQQIEALKKTQEAYGKVQEKLQGDLKNATSNLRELALCLDKHKGQLLQFQELLKKVEPKGLKELNTLATLISFGVSENTKKE